MGQEMLVQGPVDLGPALARLEGRGEPVQIIMVDGALCLPTSAPPPAFRELRLRTPDGMITVQRRGGDLALVVFGNASPALLAARERLARAMNGDG